MFVGKADPYLNADVACHFHSLFPDFELFLLPEARHFPQLDESEEVARLILSAPVQGISSAVAQTDASASVNKVRVPVLPPEGKDA
jgi:hypothetical protein